MKHFRTSRKQVERICEACSDNNIKYELIISQQLGDRQDYWYTYGIKTMIPKYTQVNFRTGEIETKSYQTGWQYSETLVEGKSLKDVYQFMMNLMDAQLEEIRNGI